MKYLFVLLLFLTAPVQAKAGISYLVNEPFADQNHVLNDWAFYPCTPPGGNGELDTCATSFGNNASVSPDGYIVTARKEQDGTYTMAMLQTKNSYRNFQFETYALFPQGQGIWPNIWCSGVGGNGIREIDSGERNSAIVTNGLNATIHYGDNYTTDHHQVSHTNIIANLESTWVKIKVIADPVSISIYHNDVLQTSVDRNVLSATGKNPLQGKFKCQIDFSIGGDTSWGGRVDDAILPKSLYVKYFQICDGSCFADREGQPAFSGNPNQLLH